MICYYSFVFYHGQEGKGTCVSVVTVKDLLYLLSDVKVAL